MRTLLGLVVLSMIGCSSSATRKEAQAPPRERPAPAGAQGEGSLPAAAPDAAPPPKLPSALRRAPLAPDAGASAGPPCEVGVPECDDYIAKYAACVSSHVPEASRKILEQALESTCVTWRKVAEDPSARQALSRACRNATAAAAKAMTAFGCAW